MFVPLNNTKIPKQQQQQTHNNNQANKNTQKKPYPTLLFDYFHEDI